MCHLASAQYWDRPAGGNTGRLFLTFGGPVCADQINSCPPPLELFVEEGELSDEQDLTEQDLPTSEEQTYRETMRGIRSFMGWSHVPDIDSSNPSDDNPFAGPKAPK